MFYRIWKLPTVMGPILLQLSGKRNKLEGWREDIRLFEKAENEKVTCSVG